MKYSQICTSVRVENAMEKDCECLQPFRIPTRPENGHRSSQKNIRCDPHAACGHSMETDTSMSRQARTYKGHKVRISQTLADSRRGCMDSGIPIGRATAPVTASDRGGKEGRIQDSHIPDRIKASRSNQKENGSQCALAMEIEVKGET
jgi:hypothetical protein